MTGLLRLQPIFSDIRVKITPITLKLFIEKAENTSSFHSINTLNEVMNVKLWKTHVEFTNPKGFDQKSPIK